MSIRNLILPAAFSLVLMVTGMSGVNAQRIEISPFAGYETGATLYTSLGYLYIKDGMDYGVNADFRLGAGNRFLEVSFSHMMTELNIDEGYNEVYVCDLGVNYYSLGLLQETKPLGRFTPYGLFSLGVVNYKPQDTDISGENKMHFSLAGGIRIKATDRIGIRLQARLLMPVMYAGTYFSGGTGGADMSVSATSVAFQGDFTAALVFAIR